MPGLKKIPELIIIGGSSRNVGKTTLALKLIEKYSLTEKITGLKVTSIRSDEETFHGNHHYLPSEGYRIIEEKESSGKKDTSRMLKAGAHKAFYIETPDHMLIPAVTAFLGPGNTTNPIVCESRSLRNVVIPGLFILLKHYDNSMVKPGFDFNETLADLIFTIDPKSINSDSIAESIDWDGNTWKLMTRK